MDSINIEGTPKTPTISFDAKSGNIEIKGRSIPENSIEFYKPLVDWLDKYCEIAEGNVNVNIQLEYFNTSSSKCILDVFKKHGVKIMPASDAHHPEDVGTLIKEVYERIEA